MNNFGKWNALLCEECIVGGVHFFSIDNLSGSDCADCFNNELSALIALEWQLPDSLFVPDNEWICAIYCTLYNKSFYFFVKCPP